MSFKSVTAKNLQFRVPLAVRVDGIGTFGAAYKKPGGIVVIARSDGKHIEVKATDRVTVSYTPVEDGAVGIKWCHKCEGGKHPFRVAADKHATAYCDVRDKAVRQRLVADRKANNPVKGARQEAQEVKAAEREERVTTALTRLVPSREAMMASVLRARLRIFGSDSASWVDACKGFRLDHDAAMALALGGSVRHEQGDDSSAVAA